MIQSKLLDRLKNSYPLAWGLPLLWGSFWVLPLFLSRQQLFDIVNSVSIVASLGVVKKYGPGAWEAIKTRRWHDLLRAHFLTLGIAVAWLAVLGRNSWMWAWRLLDYPKWMEAHPFLAFVVFVIATAGVMHIIAHDMIEDDKEPPEHPPRYRLFGATAYLLIGFVLGAIVVGAFHPNAEP